MATKVETIRALRIARRLWAFLSSCTGLSTRPFAPPPTASGKHLEARLRARAVVRSGVFAWAGDGGEEGEPQEGRKG